MQSRPRPGITSISATLAWRAEHEPDRVAFTFLRDDGITETDLSYGELFAQASAVAAELERRRAVGERVLLLYPTGEAYVTAIYGCLLAGAVAVPAYPPRTSARALARVSGIVADAKPIVALTTCALQGTLPPMDGVSVLATDAGLPPASGWTPTETDDDRLAVLQYTSGSTRAPRGVMVTHGNLQHNMSLICRGFQMSADDQGVIWLPSYHDMGLVGGVLVPPYVGFPVLLMAPSTFVQRPIRWLETIARRRGTISGGPNFAFDLCVARTTVEERQAIDLSSWRVAFTGAEPIRSDTLERFADAFAGSRFRRSAFYPCYGLAEATLMVTGGEGPGEPRVVRIEAPALAERRAAQARDDDDTARALVACGEPMPDTTVAIVNPDTGIPSAPGEVGEIWVAGPSRAHGYWNAPEESARAFEARLGGNASSEPFLRTGDLGFLTNGELFVVGRLKDLLILYGRNHYPPDIEWTVEHSHDALASNASAAFSTEIDGEERLVVVAEVTRAGARQVTPRDDGGESVIRAIRDAVAREHELPVHAVLLAGPLAIPRTSSGKIQRYRCRERYLEGSFEPLARWEAGTAVPRVGPPSTATANAAEARSIEEWLVAHIGGVTGLAPREIDRDRPFAYLGLTSLQAVALTNLLERHLQRRLSPALAYDYPTISSLARHLAGADDTAPAAAPIAGDRALETGAVAIVGMACRLPGAPDLESFWRLLVEGREATGEVPADRRRAWDAYARDLADGGNALPRRGGFLASIDGFDPDFFAIIPREAASIDPQQRLLLELAVEALEDAGLPREALRGSRTGVFVGVSSSDYSHIGQDRPEHVDPYLGTGNAQSIAANRLSYTFDLRGPSLAVDTACSSSLVALHLACESLRRGECEVALVGGANVVLMPSVSASFARAGFLAPDGRCKAFDASADGYGRGEGAGLVVIKPLARALADGDRVYAVIRGSAVNSDGRTNGLTAPSRRAQEEVMREAYARAAVDPSRVQYVEAHGTGTPLGDPIEVEALANVVGAGRPSGDICGIGSVKTNIGHLEAAAGIAGLIKTALAIAHGQIPPSLHYEKGNPHIPFDRLALRVENTRRDWSRNGAARIAGVSSFGFGGTNAHVVLEEAPAQTLAAAKIPGPPELHPLIVTAIRADALRSLAGACASMLDARVEDDDSARARFWRDVCHTAALRRSHHAHRLVVLADSPAAAADLLRAFVEDGRGPGIFHGEVVRGLPPPAAGDAATLHSDRRSQLEALAKRFVEGGAVEWHHVLPPAGRVITLPQHPWQRRRYWIETAAADRGGHPLLGRRLDLATSAATVWEGAVSTARFPYFLDHRFQGAALVPGTTYVEMAIAAAIDAFGAKPLILDDVEFQSPLVLSDDTERRTQVVLAAPSTEGGITRARFQIFSRPITDPEAVWTLHAVGVVAADENGARDGCASLTESNRAAAQADAVEHLSGEEYFSELQSRGFEYGPAFRGLRSVWRRPGEALGRLEVPDDLRPTLPSYHLHPALLDAGAQLLVATDEGAGRPFLPAGVDRVRVFPGRGRPEWGRAVYRAAKVGGLPGFHGDVQLFDGDGVLVAEATGLRVQYLEAAQQASADSGRQSAPAWTEWLYELQWEPRPADVSDTRIRKGVWILFADSGGVADRLAVRLRVEGNRCVLARRGEAFAEVGEDEYSIRATNADDIRTVFDSAMAHETRRLCGVAHLWTLDAAPMARAGEREIHEANELGIAAGVAIAQALAARAHPEPARLWFATRGAQSAASTDASAQPIQAPLWGLGRTLFQEHADLAGALVDLDPDADADSAAADLVAELRGPAHETQVAFRGQVRYTPSLVRGPNLSRLEADEHTGGATVHESATYVITGGLGGLGLAVARWLVERGARHLLLIGRAQLPPRQEWATVLSGSRAAEQIAAVVALETAGASIHLASVDVSDEAGVRAALERLDADGAPPVRGVIHAAGVVHDEILMRVNASTLDAVLKAKVFGGWVLDRCFAGNDLDFFVLFSSAASLLGSAGQGVYSAANAFLDALAHRRHARGLRALSINWGPWAGAGMAADTAAESRLTARGIASIPADVGLDVFGRLLQISAPQIGVVAIDWAKAAQSFPAMARAPMFSRVVGTAASSMQRAAAFAFETGVGAGGTRATVLAAPADQREGLVAALLRTQIAAVSGLSVDAIDPDRPLDELGIDSLTSIELKASLEQAFEVTIPVVRLLEYPTVSGLAGLVLDALRRTGVADSSPATPAAPPPSSSRTKVVVIRAAGADAPLFCIHPGALDAECYTELAHSLGEEPPFYALQPPELDYIQRPRGDRDGPIGIEPVAASCLDAMRAVQPFGPYRLAGWSLGGVVAFEIARQLVAESESVALLALFDSPPPDDGPPAEWDDVALLRMFAGYLAARRSRLFVLPTEGDAPDAEYELRRVARHAVAAEIVPPHTGVDQLRTLYETYRDGVRAGTELLRRYRPAPYGGRLAYFRATENANLPGYALPNASTIWSRLAAHVDVHDVPGSHYTLFLNPHARELAARLREYL